MKIYKLFFIGMLSLAACKKDITTLNIETKRPAIVPAASLFNYAVKSYTDAITSASVNTNVFRFTVSHWAMVTYQEEAQYDFGTRNIPQGWWTIMFRDVLQNLNQSATIIKADALLDAGEKNNKLAILDIMQVVAYSTLVNTFGNIPYSQALDQNNLFPKYDDAKTVSLDLIKRLNSDISKLNASAAGFEKADDLIYGGDVAKWIKFANTLRMQQALILADIDNNTAQTAFESSNSAAFNTAEDKAAFIYMDGAPNQNPLYVDIFIGKRGDYVVAKDLVDKLTDLSDPRLSQYCTTNASGQYVGGIVGKVNTIADISKPSPKTYAATAETLLLDYVEAEFYRAEAAERGYAVTETAAIHYNNAITASILYWGGSLGDAATYLAKPEVAYATAAGTWKQKIGIQKWIALYNRPFSGWTELRRLDFPKITAPVAARSGFPNRLTYPANEQQLNGTNYSSAAAAIGGDKVETKLFWDRF